MDARKIGGAVGRVVGRTSGFAGGVKDLTLKGAKGAGTLAEKVAIGVPLVAAKGIFKAGQGIGNATAGFMEGMQEAAAKSHLGEEVADAVTEGAETASKASKMRKTNLSGAGEAAVEGTSKFETVKNEARKTKDKLKNLFGRGQEEIVEEVPLTPRQERNMRRRIAKTPQPSKASPAPEVEAPVLDGVEKAEGKDGIGLWEDIKTHPLQVAGATAAGVGAVYGVSQMFGRDS